MDLLRSNVHTETQSGSERVVRQSSPVKRCKLCQTFVELIDSLNFENKARGVENPHLLSTQIGDGPDVLLAGPHVTLEIPRGALPQSGVMDTVLTAGRQGETERERQGGEILMQ